jgi:steroid delta-isomerase-like uncharacterized protein
MHNVQSTLLYKWFNEVWNNSDESAIDKLMTQDATAHGISGDQPVKGAAGFKSFFNDFQRQFRDIRIDVDDVISEDGIETARTTVHAVHTGTNKPVEFSGICMVKVEDGKIAEAWNNYDFLNMYQQIGHKLAPVS